MNRPSLNVLPLFVGCVLVLSCSAHTADDTAEQGETDADDTDALADALNDTATDTATDPPPQGDIDASSDVTTDGAPLDADATIDAADAEDTIGFPECVEVPCPDGYECFTEGCLPVIAPGERCGDALGVMCARGSTCTTFEPEPRCVPDGTLGGFCRYGFGGECVLGGYACDAGLACDTTLWSSGLCVPGLVAGDLCGGPGDLCPADAPCALDDGVPRCMAAGSAGGGCVGASGTQPLLGSCDEGLVCDQANSECVRRGDRCRRAALPGAACDDEAVLCVPGEQCVDTLNGRVCAPDGTAGSDCSTTGAACGDGLVCGSTTRGLLSCATTAELGQACDGQGRFARCGAGLSCTSDHPADRGVCVAAGTVAGADCRVDAPRCDDDLVCSDFSRYRQTCRRVATIGEACDLGALATTCAEGSRCAPVGRRDDGTTVAECIGVVDEREPNGRLDPGTALASSAVIAAGLGGGETTDCAHITVGTDQALFVELWDPAFDYTHPKVVRLWHGDEELGRWSLLNRAAHGPLGDTVRLEPDGVPMFRSLEAGEMTLCVEYAGPDPVDYTLTIGVF